MRSVVVYESMYGNSHRVAAIVGQALEAAGPVSVVPTSAADAELVASADLVVVGGPTHIHTMSSHRSRDAAKDAAIEDAAKHGTQPLVMDPHWQDPGLRDWFAGLSRSNGQMAAAFDTRLDARALLTGRASKLIARKLKRHGFDLIAEPESFLVDKSTTLLDAEARRAEHWAIGLRTVASATYTSHWSA